MIADAGVTSLLTCVGLGHRQERLRCSVQVIGNVVQPALGLHGAAWIWPGRFLTRALTASYGQFTQCCLSRQSRSRRLSGDQEGFSSVASSDLSQEHQIGSTKEPWRRILPFLGLGNLLSLLTIISSLCALLFLVRPTLKPREEVGATIDKVKLERNVTLRGFLDRAGLVFHGPDADLMGWSSMPG